MNKNRISVLQDNTSNGKIIHIQNEEWKYKKEIEKNTTKCIQSLNSYVRNKTDALLYFISEKEATEENSIEPLS